MSSAAVLRRDVKRRQCLSINPSTWRERVLCGCAAWIGRCFLERIPTQQTLSSLASHSITPMEKESLLELAGLPSSTSGACRVETSKGQRCDAGTCCVRCAALLRSAEGTPISSWASCSDL